MIIILIPIIGSLFYSITIPKIKDIKYALNEKLLVYEGEVEKTYITGWPNTFTLDGGEYQYNPWKFKPNRKEIDINFIIYLIVNLLWVIQNYINYYLYWRLANGNKKVKNI